MKKTTPKTIKTLKKNEIFVFGSNGQGNHAGGAAKLALDKFGAIKGQAKGLQGKSYAINTMDCIDTIKSEVVEFIDFAKENNGLVFLVTEIGCGIAGYKPEEIAPFFTEAKNIQNVYLPQSFLSILNEQKEEFIISYKGFDKDLKCRGFQYEIGKEYEHNGSVSACNSGFHACENPFDVWNYYDLKNGNRFALVEQSGDISRESSDSKIASRKIKITAEIGLPVFIKAGFEYIHKKTFDSVKEITSGDNSHSATSGKYSNSATSGDNSHSATSGKNSHSATSGKNSHSATSGDNSHSATSGDNSHSATSGKYSNSATSGNNSHSATSGNNSNSATSGKYSNSATSGDNSHSATSGDNSHSATSGDDSHSATSGYNSHSATSGKYSHSATSGDNSHSATSGYNSHSATSGKYSNSATSGYNSHSATSGKYSNSATSGNYSNSATSGKYSNSATSGDNSHSATSGKYSNSATSGYNSHSATSGKYSNSATSGDNSQASVEDIAVAASIGLNAKAKGVTGSWIVLSEWKEINWNEREIVCVKSALVDGVTIKANTYYKLINGEFTEA